MSFTTTLRGRQRPRARMVLAVLMLVWLNVVLQPCLMAMPLAAIPADQSSHQYEIQPSSQLARHNTAHKAHDQHSDCIHCAVFGRGDCGEGGGCGQPDVVQSNSAVKLKDGASTAMVALPVSGVMWQMARQAAVADVIPRAEPPPHGQSLRIRHCVYLI